MNLLCFGKIHHGYRDVNVEDDRESEFLTPNMSLRGNGVQILMDRELFLLSLLIYHILKARQGKITRYITLSHFEIYTTAHKINCDYFANNISI